MSPDRNSIDLADRLKKVESLPVGRDEKTVLQLAVILAGFLAEISQAIADQAMDSMLRGIQGEYHAIMPAWPIPDFHDDQPDDSRSHPGIGDSDLFW